MSHLKSLIGREYNRIFDQLRTVDLEKITELTNCSKPCHYNKYSFITDGEMSAFKSDKFLFSLWAVSHYTKVSTEQLIYPVTRVVKCHIYILGAKLVAIYALFLR